MPEHERSSDRERAAAIDAAQEQLKAAAAATLDEHLRLVAQRRVDEELEALRESGVWDGTNGNYVVSVSLMPSVADE
jgi:hypothetical protein